MPPTKTLKQLFMGQRRIYTYHVYKGNGPKLIEAALEQRGVWRPIKDCMLMRPNATPARGNGSLKGERSSRGALTVGQSLQM